MCYVCLVASKDRICSVCELEWKEFTKSHPEAFRREKMQEALTLSDPDDDLLDLVVHAATTRPMMDADLSERAASIVAFLTTDLQQRAELGTPLEWDTLKLRWREVVYRALQKNLDPSRLARQHALRLTWLEDFWSALSPANITFLSRVWSGHP